MLVVLNIINKLFIFILLSLYVYWIFPIVNSWFWLIDDHEIFALLGNIDNCKFINFWSIYNSIDEIKGNGTRYRPLYYFIKVFESISWCDNFLTWQISHFLIFIISIIFLALPYRKYGSTFFYFIIFLLISLPFFVDIVPRLGPQEIYGLIFFSLYVYIINRLFIQKIKQYEISIIFIWTFVSTILMGIKEPFIQVFIISLVVVFFNYNKNIKKTRNYIFASLIIQFIVFAYVVINIIERVSVGQIDTYGNSINPFLRLSNSMANLPLQTWVICILLILIYCVKFKVSYGNNIIKNIKNEDVFQSNPNIILFLLFLLLLNIIVYNGEISLSSRYAMPILLFIFLYLFHLIGYEYINNKFSIKKEKLFFIKKLLLLTCVFIAFSLSYKTKNYVQKNSEKRINIHNQIKFLIMNKNNYDTIAINFNDKYAYEPLFAIRAILAFYNIKNQLVITHNNEEVISEQLNLFSINGMAGVSYFSLKLDPITKGGKNVCQVNNCFILEISNGW